MSFQPSTPEELRACERLIRAKELRIRRLVAAGKKVHIIWDVDHVLVSGRSDDAFGVLGYDVRKYFQLEERLVTQPLEWGPWAPLANRCGEPGLQTSQDIVTARSSFLALRVMFFLLMQGSGIPIRWQLFVGHQPKSDSYRIILQSFLKDPDTHIFCVDDAKKHVDAFIAVAAELGMTDRCHGVLAPQIRRYDEAEVRREIDGVLSATGDRPTLIEVSPRRPDRMERYVQVVPDPAKAMRTMLMGASMEAHMRATVDRYRETLEKFSDEVAPGQPKTDERLYALFEMLREPR